MRRLEHIPAESHLLILCWIAGMGLLFVAPGVGIGVVAAVAGCGLLRTRRAQRQQERLQLAHARARVPGRPRARLRRQRQVAAAPILVPVFSDHEPLEALVRLAHLLDGPGERVHVMRLEEIPPESPLCLFREDDPQVLAQFARASDSKPACSFEGLLTHRSAELLHERASEPHTRWVVMGWKPTSAWRRALDPLARFLDAPPCPAIVYRPAPALDPLVAEGPLEPRRILVFATRGQGDATLLHLASRVAASNGTDTISVVYLASLEATREDLHEIRSYHESLGLRGVRSKVEIVRASDPLDALTVLARRFDILILGREREQGLRTWLQEPFADRVAHRTSCAVLQLRAEGWLSALDTEYGRAPSVNAALDFVEVVPHESATPHTAWFRRIEGRFEEQLGDRVRTSWDQAPWEMERIEHPAPSVGVTALYWTSIPGLDRLHLGLWVLGTRADCDSPGSERRDLCLALIGPPSQEPARLALLEGLRNLSNSAPWVLALCAAETLSDANTAIHEIEHRGPEE
jgi:nucleotide-binding universal stress UspA family protein